METPESDVNGNTPTLNQYGVMSNNFGILYNLYLNEIQPNDRCLDVGCAYGNTVIAAVQKGAYVWANDLCEDHLLILQNKIGDESVKYLPGDILEITLPNNFYDKVILASVLHFMSGSNIINTLTRIYNTLKPNGKVYILTTSPHPYLNTYPLFADKYHQRKEKDWPGHLLNTWKYLPHLKDKVPKECTFAELNTLKDAVIKVGFKITLAQYEPSSYHPAGLQLKGDEFINIVAQK